MKPATISRANGLPTPPLREYYSRVLAYIATAASIAAGTYVGHFAYDILWMVPYALLYPHLAHNLSRRFKRDYPQQTDLALLFFDALHAGAACVLLGFSAVPSLMFLLILCFSALVVGGMRYLGLGLLVAASGMALCAALVGIHPNTDTPTLVALVSILFATLYICITAYFVNQQGLRLAQVRSEIKREQERPRAWRATWPSTCHHRSGNRSSPARRACAWRLSARSSRCSSPISRGLPSCRKSWKPKR